MDALRMTMFCKHCGVAIPEGALHCPMCGAAQTPATSAPVEPVAPVEVPVASVPVEPVAPVAPVETPVAYAPVAPAPAFEAPNFEAPEPKKKRSLKKIIIPIVAVVSAAAVLLCVFNWGWISKFFLDKFSKPEKLRDKVVAEQTETLADAMSSKYGNSIESLKNVVAGGKNVSATVELVVGDKVENIVSNFGLEEYGDIGEIIDVLNGSYVTISGGSEDDVIRAAIQAGLGGEELLSIGAVADLAAKELYVAVPMFTDLHLDLSDVFADLIDEVVGSLDVEDIEAMAAMGELLEAMPSEETVNKLLTKYIGLALAEFDDVSKEKDDLSIGGIKESVTVLETSISEADAMDAMKAVMKELAKDSDVKKIIKDLVNTINDIEDTGMTADEVYESFVAAIEGALEGSDEYEPSTDELAVLVQYLNASYEVVGLALEVDGQEMVYYATATKGKNFACEMEYMGQTIVTGKGTNQKGIVNGTYEIGFAGETYVSVEVSNFDKNTFEKGFMKGSFLITPEEALMDQVLGGSGSSMVGSVLSMIDLGLKLDIDTSAEKSTYQIGLADDGEVLVGIKLITTLTSGEVDVPDADETTANVQQWLNSFDVSDLLDSLEDLGVPSDLLVGAEDAFEDVLGELIDSAF